MSNYDLNLFQDYQKANQILEAESFNCQFYFNKVWHEGLLFKIKQMGITVSLFDWLKSYIPARCQKVVLNGMESNLCFLESGVPQGSILGPLLFLIFINDIVDEMECNINLFADDTSVQQRITDMTSFNKVNRDLQRLTGFGMQ